MTPPAIATSPLEARLRLRMGAHDARYAGGRAESSAEALAEPVVVCRARGTCVTPLALQSSPRGGQASR